MKARIKIKELLSDRRLSVSQVSRDTGISRTTLATWRDRPIAKVEIEKINTICNYFGLSFAELVEMVDDRKKAGA